MVKILLLVSIFSIGVVGSYFFSSSLKGLTLILTFTLSIFAFVVDDFDLLVEVKEDELLGE